MHQDRSPHPYNPPASRQTPAYGYAPPPGFGLGDVHHPLHSYYRRQIRGVRLRWLLLGFFFGALMACSIGTLVSLLLYTRIPAVAQKSTGAPEITITLTEVYLNTEAAERLGAGYELGVPGLSLRALRIDLGPDNRLDFQADFRVELALIGADLTATIRNQVVVQDGRVVISMVGDPQIGNLDLPIGALPFNLNERLKEAVDRINEAVLGAELNQNIESSVTGTDLYLDSITTDDTTIDFHLRRR